MDPLGLLIVAFACLGVVAVLLTLGFLVMWLMGRRPGKGRAVRWISRSVVGVFAIVGALFSGWWLLELSNRDDKRMIDGLYIRFHTALHDGDFQTAYSCMAPGFRRSHSIDQFKNRFANLGEPWLALEPGRYLTVWQGSAKLHPRSGGLSMSGPVYKLVKKDEAWYFTGEYAWLLD